MSSKTLTPPAAASTRPLHALTLDELRAEERRLRDAYAAAVQEREHIEGAPLPLAEVIARMEAHVDERAAYWRHERGLGLLQLFGDPRRVPSLPAWFHGAWSKQDEMGFAPAATKTALRELLEAVPYEAGPPRAARAALLEAATATVERLEQEHTTLVEFIAQGHDAPPAYLPHVAARKTEEAAHAKRDAERVQEAIEAADAADRWHRAASSRRRYVPSTYITRRG